MSVPSATVMGRRMWRCWTIFEHLVLPAAGRVTSREVLMKVQARMAETGVLLRADSDADWAIARPFEGSRPDLFCPVCRVRVTAVQRPKEPEPGKLVTRWFKFVPGERCEHRKVQQGVTVRQPSSRVGETAEHAWLKRYVLNAALKAGFPGAELEQALNGAVRADVRVPGAVAGTRVEVQRVETDILCRTEDYADVVWLLRADIAARNADALFTSPCVRVRISALGHDGRPMPAEPWVDGCDASVRATSTLLRPRSTPREGRHGFFEPCKLELDEFLKQVWTGKRVWCAKDQVHRFAGWVTPRDKRRYEAWLARQQERRVEDQKRRTVAPPAQRERRHQDELRQVTERQAQRERLRQQQRREAEERDRQEQAAQERARQAEARRERLLKEREKRAEKLLALDPTRRPLPPPSETPARQGFWRRVSRWLRSN